jgi:hypothetical protein
MARTLDFLQNLLRGMAAAAKPEFGSLGVHLGDTQQSLWRWANNQSGNHPLCVLISAELDNSCTDKAPTETDKGIRESLRLWYNNRCSNPCC